MQNFWSDETMPSRQIRLHGRIIVALTFVNSASVLREPYNERLFSDYVQLVFGRKRHKPRYHIDTSISSAEAFFHSLRCFSSLDQTSSNYTRIAVAIRCTLVLLPGLRNRCPLRAVRIVVLLFYSHSLFFTVISDICDLSRSFQQPYDMTPIPGKGQLYTNCSLQSSFLVIREKRKNFYSTLPAAKRRLWPTQ